ncbi:MAG: Mur ligase family protein [Acidimicrobiia bacterium]
MIEILAAASVLGAAVAAMRWLRVAQREHYLPGVTRFARLWWGIDGGNRVLFALGVASCLLALVVPPAGLVAVAAALMGPLGLGVKGRTSSLAWTARLRRLAGVAGFLALCLVAIGVWVEAAWFIAAVPLGLPLVVDAGLRLTASFERSRGNRWVAQAAESLVRIDPTVVAITGSYGKTSTKNLVSHLLGGVRAVTASPASFNNRMGLARAVNEHLAAGTDVFVAEMGTYGPGEIRDLCEWIPPDVAVITALGPVHLERMRSLATIASAKREILEGAPVAVVSVDHPLLAKIATEEAASRRIVTASGSGNTADVCATADGTVVVAGVEVGRFQPERAHPGNVACAVGVLVALDIDLGHVASRLGELPEVAHRRTVGRSERGFDIVDDTFNANPAGARAALELLSGLGRPRGRKVVVTPGMIELGAAQDAANRTFALDASQHGVTDFVVVNRTNRPSLVTGAREAGIASVIVLDTREEAVRWVRETLAEGDAILYENDLPDHYP